MNRSAFPLASGHRRVIWWCLNASPLANSAKLSLCKGGPLSDFTISGLPTWVNTLRSCLKTIGAESLCIILTTGYLEKSSTTTMAYLTSRKGSAKSNDNSVHGPRGSSWIGKGSRWCTVVLAWQATKLLTVWCTRVSIPGNHTMSGNSYFALKTPWWPQCARCTAFREVVLIALPVCLLTHGLL